MSVTGGGSATGWLIEGTAAGSAATGPSETGWLFRVGDIDIVPCASAIADGVCSDGVALDSASARSWLVSLAR